MMDDKFQKDKFDAYMKLAELRLGRHKTRADVEWKISLALWALMAAAPFAFEKAPLTITPTTLAVIGGALVTIVVGHMLLWTGQIWIRNRDDQDTAFYYIETAETLLRPDYQPKHEVKPAPNHTLTRKNLKALISFENWGVWFQTLATLLIASGVFWVFALRLTP